LKKTYLIKYELPKYFVLADYMEVILSLKSIWFWGLFTTFNNTTYRIYNNQPFKPFFDHWDYLIENKKQLGKK